MSLDMSGRARSRPPRTTAGQHLCLLVGVLLALLGVAGFFVTGFGDWTGGSKEQQVIGFAVNPLSNVVHLVLAAIALVGRTGRRRARWSGIALFVLGVALFAVAANVGEDGGLLNLNWPTTTLHGVMAAAGLVIAFVPVRTAPGPGTAELR
jgi:peptidoglycan/LPS O-acetylase OafA/YrhL